MSGYGSLRCSKKSDVGGDSNRVLLKFSEYTLTVLIRQLYGTTSIIVVRL